MPAIVSVSTEIPPYTIDQKDTENVVRELFKEPFQDIDRLLKIFDNGQIEKRNFVVPKEWFEQDHSFKEKNDLYIQESVNLGVEAVQTCLGNKEFLQKMLDPADIDAIFYISSSGLSTPTVDAKIMNVLPFSPNTKRIPIWGLGCAGGGAGIARAYEYCMAYPNAKVLVLCSELCSLTFQRNDVRKSNLVGTSLFADGVACALVVGDDVLKKDSLAKGALPFIKGVQSTLMPQSEDVMGWDVTNEGLQVIFSRDIPNVIKEWLKPNVEQFLEKQGIELRDIKHFVAHPGGKKVLEAYEQALDFTPEMTDIPRQVLKENGNMSSPTVLYVLKKFMESAPEDGDIGLMTTLGPGFSSELIQLKWREV
ncbi:MULTISPECIES: type III polyketide synthase [Bacillaceae]|uniref:Type III polyketide synthase n=1 Tax=Evansella alkalicola TaxID=745819 RepID=A0ABS6JRQ8_9BACI|nr:MULTISPECIES: 3-oxoacyl-[acyl-carrier-protein] synthase III C-terminal domain-containing protein [Bacillaceae]MBU9721235.1 type III polyketide synthase [Bacillus alkalicola]